MTYTKDNIDGVQFTMNSPTVYTVVKTGTDYVILYCSNMGTQCKTVYTEATITRHLNDGIWHPIIVGDLFPVY